ncbi:hypothetical protein Tco_0368406 [Tanacetum coccineum]
MVSFRSQALVLTLCIPSPFVIVIVVMVAVVGVERRSQLVQDQEDILSGVHLTSVVIEVDVATVNSPEVPQHDEAEIVHNMSVENKLYFQAEKEAIFLHLISIGDEIYSTVDACNTTNEM